MADSSRISLPESLQRLRRELDLTQEQLAAQLGVSVRTVSRWEQGESEPRGAGQKQAIREISKSASKETAAMIAAGIGAALLPFPLPFGPIAAVELFRMIGKVRGQLAEAVVEPHLRTVASALDVSWERFRSALAPALSSIAGSGTTLAQLVEMLSGPERSGTQKE